MSWILEFWQWLSASSPLELVAVVSLLAYLVLIIFEKPVGWLLAFAGTAIYIYLFWGVSLPLNSILNAYYAFMAIYGWWMWQKGRNDTGDALHIHRRPWLLHGGIVVLTALAGVLVYTLMGLVKAQGELQMWDAQIAVFSVVATLLTVRKVLENWWYWMAIDSATAWMSYQAGLHATVVLMALYVMMAVAGWWNWHRLYREQVSVAQAAG